MGAVVYCCGGWQPPGWLVGGAGGGWGEVCHGASTQIPRYRWPNHRLADKSSPLAIKIAGLKRGASCVKHS